MKKVLLLLLITCHYTLQGQQNNGLAISLEPLSMEQDSCCVYNLTIINHTDSIACILHSMFISLTSSTPQGIALYQQTSSKEYYSLHYSFNDTIYDFESLPYRGECILPYQVLSFKIKVRGAKMKEKKFRLEYIYLRDISYRKFMEEMKKVGLWYHKYKRIEKNMTLP